MDVATEIEDPSDWLNTSLSTFLPLDNAFRCQVCKDFYDTPMITSCSHTFCSKCIRTCLSADGKCPTCRTADQASKLRNNLAIEEAVGAFKVARPPAYKIALKDKQEVDEEPRRPGKRRRTSYNDEIPAGEDSRRQTRSMRIRQPTAPTHTDGAIEIMDSDYEEEDYTPDDGLVACPICSTRMKEHQVDPHIDGECDGTKKEDKAGRKQRSAPNKAANVNPLKRPPSRPQSSKPMERLAELNYSLLNEKALRKKLQELGLPCTGSKVLLKERHIEYLNLWNANCDSSQPKTKDQLLSELRKWERSQGGQAREMDSDGIMKKDFDVATWQSNNKDDFTRLIEQARRKRDQAKSKKPEEDGSENVQSAEEKSLEQEGVSTMDMDTPIQQSPFSAVALRPQPEEAQEQPQQTSDSNSASNSSHPYENNPEALSSIREKVKAANAGTHIEPLMNEGFQSDAISHSKQAPTTNSPLYHYGKRSSVGGAYQVPAGSGRQQPQEQQRQGESAGIPIPSLRKSESLPDHFAEPADRKMPMFRVPEDPVSDNEIGGSP